MNAKALHEKVVLIAKTYLKAESELIDILQQIGAFECPDDRAGPDSGESPICAG